MGLDDGRSPRIEGEAIKMKLTKSQLKKIIKEELSSILNEEKFLVRAYRHGDSRGPDPDDVYGGGSIFRVEAESEELAIEIVRNSPKIDPNQPIEIVKRSY